MCKFIHLLLIIGRGTNNSQNRDINGFNNLFLSCNIIKYLVVLLNNSILLLNADCASIVNLSAFNKTIVLKNDLLQLQH